MWTRLEIKTKAKAVLRNTYLTAFAISLILYIAGASYSLNNSNNNNNTNHDENIRYSIGVLTVTDYNISIDIGKNSKISTTNPLNPIYGLIIVPSSINLLSSLFNISLFILVLSALFLRIIVGYHFQVGGYKYFINAAENRESGIRNLSMGFQTEYYWNILNTMFLRDLYHFLWTLLFIIPGIIKKYSYTFVPYILADNPKIEPNRAIRISMDITQGHKLDMFILNLSFIGWYMLGSIAFGIGVSFVWPYENATYSQLYLILRQKAITNGIISADELNTVPYSQ